MPSKKLILCDEKVRFKGRFCTDALNEVTMAKLTAAVSNNKGKKTRLKLTREGVSCGQMFGTILRNRIAAEFKPLRDVEDIVVDQTSNLLLVIVRLQDGNFEIMAFEGHPQVTKRFENTFLTVKSYDTSSIPDVHVTDNWTLRQTNKPARPTVLNMYTPQSHMNGTIPNGEMNRSRSVQDFNTSRRSSARRSRSKGRDEADGLSDTSDRSVESVKKELLSLSREVQSLRSMMEHSTNTMSTMRGMHDADSVITSASSRVPPSNSNVKTKVHDYRRTNGTTLHVDGVDSNSNYTTSRGGPDGPIHLVYRREGERNGSPLRYQASNASTMHTLRGGDSRANYHRSADTYSQRDGAGSTYSSFYPTTQRRLVTPVPVGPARVYGAAVGSLNDGNRTIYKTKSMDSPNRWKYKDSDWEGSVYSTRTYTAPTRQPRTLERKIYTSGHPDFSYVNIVPTRSQSTSRSELRRNERW